MKLQITGPKHLQYSTQLGTTIIDKSGIIWDSSELNAVSSNKYENTLIFKECIIESIHYYNTSAGIIISFT